MSQNEQELKDSEVIQNNQKDELTHLKEKILYLTSDFETYRRRAHQDCQQRVENTLKNTLLALLPVLDDFDRAFNVLAAKQQEEQQEKDTQFVSYLTGFELTYKSLKKILTDLGVREITDVITFDPTFHEAVMQADDATKESGHIVSVLQRGYMFKDTVLRPTKVSVKP